MDSIGEILVPKQKYWGAQTQRSLENFKIGHNTMPRELILSYVAIKSVVAIVNLNYGLEPKISEAIVKACDDILAEKISLDNFPLVIY